jgi:uncharacterized delta-60 repeat protein
MKVNKNLFQRVVIFSQFIVLALACFSNARAVNVDLSFRAYLGKVGKGTVYRSAVQPDGKIIVTGSFTMVEGLPKSTIVRLNTNGTLDTSFNPPSSITGWGDMMIAAIGLQSDGKIIIGGRFYQLDGVQRHGIARLNTDGTLDQSFNVPPGLANPLVVYDLKVYPDNTIILSGLRNFNTYTVMRVNADGSLINEAANVGAFKLGIQPDGKIVYASNSNIRRLNADLTPDDTFTAITTNNNGIYTIAIQPSDGKILFGGAFNQVNGTPAPSLVRANANGGVDVAFTVNSSNSSPSIQAILVRPDGKILVGGYGLELRNQDGTYDSSFVPPSMTTIYDLDLQADGKIIVSGLLLNPPQTVAALMARLNPDGALDTSFQPVIGGYGSGSKVVVLPDNKFLVSGDFNYTGGVARRYFAKFNADGTVDTTFNPNLPNITFAPNFEVFPDGKVLVRTLSGSQSVIKLFPDGSQEFAFSLDNVGDIKTLPDGRFLISRNNQLLRYNANGTLDSTFSVLTNETIYDIAVQPDGKVIIGGNFTQVNSSLRSKIARINTDGTVDSTFPSPAGGINGVVRNVVLQPDGKMLINGSFSGISFETRQGLARLNPDSSLDTSFVPGQFYNNIDDIKLQPDGKILITGSSTFTLRRLNSNGSLDTRFIPPVLTPYEPPIQAVFDFDIQSDGKIIIVGAFSAVNGVSAPGIARLIDSQKVLFDYDGDGRADVSVFRASENRWYVLRSSDAVVAQQVFAVAGDIPVPADYDGDAKTDYAIFRPSSGDWWYLSSINNAQVFVDWGQTGDIALPGDFDGDGRADFIVFRPSNNFWYRISGATGNSSFVQFGLAGDKPVRGDFDGDGKSDVAIYRPSTGDWWWQSSIDNVQRATRWGISTDIPAPANYDADGKTDFAVYRPSNGTWYIYNSLTNSSTIMNFGIAEDKPVPADYDGDGKADIAVFRPSTGVWYLMRTTTGFTAQQFGISSDIPTEHSFVP